MRLWDSGLKNRYFLALGVDIIHDMTRHSKLCC